MILTSTLNAELARLDREIASLTRARFAALARSDQITAGKLWREMKSLQIQRRELAGNQPNLFDTNE